MKTLQDLKELIKKEHELSKGFMCEYQIIIDEKYDWVSMFEIAHFPDKNRKTVIFQCELIDTIPRLQLVYWMM